MYKIMKKEFNWEEFKNKKMVVNCKNEEEVNNFFKECELNEIEVRSYTREFSYETYHSDVCYRCEDNDLYYADRSFYNIRGITLVNFRVEIFDILSGIFLVT